jgi:hypothetical protein
MPPLSRNTQATPQVSTPAVPPSTTAPAPASVTVTTDPPPAITSVVVPTETHIAIANTLGEIFKQFGDQAIDTALLKHKRIAAEKEKEKRHEDYLKSKGNHAKFPSIEESLRKAREHAEKQVKSLNDQLKEKDDSLKLIATSAASKIPGLLVQASGANHDESKFRERYDDLQRRCDGFREQLETQKKLFDEEKKSRQLLEKKLSELESASNTTKKTLGEAHTRQSKFENDIRSEIIKKATESDKVIQDINRDSAAIASRVQLGFDDLFGRTNGVPNVEVELNKVRKEGAEGLATLANQIKPLADGIEKIDDVDRKVGRVQKGMTDWIDTETSFKENLKKWKKDVNSDVSHAQDLARTVDNTLKQELATLKQEVARVSSKATTTTTEIPTDPNLLKSIQAIKSEVAVLQDKSKALDFSSLKKRVSACEENGKTYVKASTFSTTLDELSNVLQIVGSLAHKDELAALSNKINNMQQKGTPESQTPNTAELLKLKTRLSKLETQPASGTQTLGSKAPSPLPSSTVDTSELTQRLSNLENQLALLPDEQWVKGEINVQQDAAADVFVGQLNKVALQANETDRRVRSIETNVANITNFQGTLSSLPNQVEALQRRAGLLGTSPSSGTEIGALVNTAMKEATSALDKKHADSVAAIQLSVHNELYQQDWVYNQLESLGVAYSNLDHRYNNINTADIYKSLVDQFGHEQFPELRQIPSLENLVNATASRVAVLEKTVSNAESQWFTAHSQHRLRDIENAQKVSESTVKNLETTVANYKARGNEMDQVNHDISTLHKKLKQMKTEHGEKLAQLETDVNHFGRDFQYLANDYSNKQLGIADKLADFELKLRNPTPVARTTASPSHNISMIRDRDRTSSAPIPNGITKKRKLDNGHSTPSSVASSSKMGMNGNTRPSPASNHLSEKPKLGRPGKKVDGDDESDQDYEEVVHQPTVMDSNSESDD